MIVRPGILPVKPRASQMPVPPCRSAVRSVRLVTFGVPAGGAGTGSPGSQPNELGGGAGYAACSAMPSISGAMVTVIESCTPRFDDERLAPAIALPVGVVIR